MIAKIKSRIKQRVQGKFARNVLMMFIGTAIGQLGSVLAAPILTRLYTPEEFGILGAFTAALTILAVIALLRYELALPIADSEEDAANLFVLCAITLCVMTGLACLLTAFLTPDYFAWADLGALEPYRWLLPVGFFCLGAYQLMVYLATRHNDFKAVAKTKLYQGGAGPLTQIGLGLLHFGPLGLLLGFIIGQSMGITQLVWRLVIRKTALLRGISIQGVKAMARRFIRFPLVSAFSGLVNSAGSNNLLPVALPLLYSTTIAGYVFLTDRVIVRPLLMVSTSILQVYIGEVAKTRLTDPAAMRRRFLSLMAQQTIIVAAWLLLVNALAGYFFPILFGAEWAAAVPYLHVLSIALLPQLVTHALVHTLQILERQGLSALWEVGRLIVVAGTLIISAWYGLTALEALLAYSLCQAAAQLVLLWLMYHSIQRLQTAPKAEETDNG